MASPRRVKWLRTYAHRLDQHLCSLVEDGFRKPEWLPSWFHGPRRCKAGRLRLIPVVICVDDDGAHVRRTLRQRAHKFIHMPELKMVCASVSPTALRSLVACRGLRRICADRRINALLDRAVPAADVREVASQYTGRGVTIAIVDTGIYPHPDLSGRIVGFKDFIGHRTLPYDDNGHGTHVAGCAAASGRESDGRYRGPAPHADLVGVKVLNRLGAGSTGTTVAGIDWVIENRDRYGIRILSLSLGGSTDQGCEGDPLCEAVGRAWDAGIVVVASAGNGGPRRGSITTPGISPEIITVGAMDDHHTERRSDDTLARFSSRGPTAEGVHKPDLLAPGVRVTSLRAPGSYLDYTRAGGRTGSWYYTLSGTSMAAPIVAGISALLLEASPCLTPDDVKARLLATAEDWDLRRDEQGAGYVDGDLAVLS